MSSDPAQLARLIRLPGPAEEIVFETRALGKPGLVGPDDWRIEAVLRLKAQTVQELAATSAELGPGATPAVSSGDLPSWLLDSWRASLTVEGDGTVRFKGRAYNADAFARAPLLNGYFVVLDDGGHVYVHLSTA